MTRRVLAAAALAVAVVAPAAAAYEVISYYDPYSACTYTVWVLEDQPVRTRISCR